MIKPTVNPKKTQSPPLPINPSHARRAHCLSRISLGVRLPPVCRLSAACPACLPCPFLAILPCMGSKVVSAWARSLGGGSRICGSMIQSIHRSMMRWINYALDEGFQMRPDDASGRRGQTLSLSSSLSPTPATQPPPTHTLTNSLNTHTHLFTQRLWVVFGSSR